MPLKEAVLWSSSGRQNKGGGCSRPLHDRRRVKIEEKEKRQMKFSQSKTDVSPHVHFVSMRKRGSGLLEEMMGTLAWTSLPPESSRQWRPGTHGLLLPLTPLGFNK